MMRIYKSPKIPLSRIERHNRELEKILSVNTKLKMWLSRETWTAYEATFILAGIDPEMEHLLHHPGSPGTWLSEIICEPIGNEWPVNKASRLLIKTAAFCENKENQTPRRWIEIARTANFNPVWLEYTKFTDNGEVESANQYSPPQSPRKISLAAAAKARKKIALDPDRIVLDKVGKPLFDAWDREKITKKKLADVIFGAITNLDPSFEMAHRTIERRIDDWNGKSRHTKTSPAQQATSPARHVATKSS